MAVEGFSVLQGYVDEAFSRAFVHAAPLPHALDLLRPCALPLPVPHQEDLEYRSGNRFLAVGVATHPAKFMLLECLGAAIAALHLLMLRHYFTPPIAVTRSPRHAGSGWQLAPLLRPFDLAVKHAKGSVAVTRVFVRQRLSVYLLTRHLH
jgi:hypothetical protein